MMTNMVATIAREALHEGSARVSITTSHTAEDALAFLREYAAPHGAGLLVISDHNLKSVKTGLDVLDEAQRRHPAARIVLMTGEDPHRFEHVRERLDAFIEKPFGFLQMADLVQRLAGAPRSRALPIRSPAPIEPARED